MADLGAEDHGAWQFWIDRGGTFTDVVARRPDGTLVTHKLLSDCPGRYVDPAVAAIGHLLGAAPGEPVPASQIGAVRLGTTVATNALLERTGEPTVLVITRGFADALRIGYQNRPRLFDRQIVLAPMLYSRVIEADERMSADGTVITPLDEPGIEQSLQEAYRDGLRSVAVVLAHGYRHTSHERRVGEIAARSGFSQISLSHQVSPLMKLVARGDTTVADAYLSPLLARYSAGLMAELDGARLQFMTSSGGLTSAQTFRGKDSVLSGPAGGIVGMARVSAAAGFGKVIGFDMGGTSTDVSHYAGQYERQYETEVAGFRIRAPMLSIHTVAAGGGSVLHYGSGRYQVGPDSAGADPGPACYRRGGPLTVTDANLMLGRIQPEFFPHVFGPDGAQPADADVVAERFAAMAQQTGDGRAPEEVAAGFLEIAVANMANAVRRISVQRGYDVTEYALVTFGGAGGQHACAVADALGMTTVLIHPLAGVLSAYGTGLAELTAMRELAVEAPLSTQTLPRLQAALSELETSARAELADQGAAASQVQVRPGVHLRYDGTDTAMIVPAGTVTAMQAAFEDAYQQRFSCLMPGKQITVEAVSLEAAAAPDLPAPGTGDLPAGTAELSAPGAEPPAPGPAAPPPRTAAMFAGGRWVTAALARRQDLLPGQSAAGPAIIVEANATTVVEPGWSAALDRLGNLILTRPTPQAEASPAAPDSPVSEDGPASQDEPAVPARAGALRRGSGAAADPVRLEIFSNMFMSIAEQMGYRLQSTAHSVNIRERLDFSCAIFDADGGLIANAPHIPVHLGSMGDSVQEIITQRAGTMKPGDVYALNDPYHGGTHLPDITVITPVFGQPAEGGGVLFYVASRGHHAEIGGITPGSMPALSTHIDAEGVLIRDWLLAEHGTLREEQTAALLRGAQHPSRDPAANLADLRAQVAANGKGAGDLQALTARYGLDVVRAYMRFVQDNAEESVRAVIGLLRDGSCRYELDSGAVISVAIRVDRQRRSAEIDFTGTSPQLGTNFNAPSSVVRAAVLYVFRTLAGGDIPLNSGCLKPLHVIIPPGTMLSPEHPAAVVAGNVETSQAVTGALYAALGAMAEGSGTMNNLTFGNDRQQYYETVAIGSGAGDGFAGTDVVQTHMTNSRLTDPEVLEWRYPVRLESYEIRRGSGGAGRWPGGSGGVRRIRFLEPMTVSVLSSHRRVRPYGMAGGEPGALGRQWIEHPDGSVTSMSGCDSVQVAAGDMIVMHTPGGGGYGAAG